MIVTLIALVLSGVLAATSDSCSEELLLYINTRAQRAVPDQPGSPCRAGSILKDFKSSFVDMIKSNFIKNGSCYLIEGKKLNDISFHSL